MLRVNQLIRKKLHMQNDCRERSILVSKVVSPDQLRQSSESDSH